MTLISIAEQRQALYNVFTQVDNLSTVFQRFPREIQESELPALIIRIDDGEYMLSSDAYGSRVLVHKRNWVATLYVMRVQQGTEYQAEEAAEPFLTSIAEALAANKRLISSAEDGNRAFDVLSDGITDSGLLMLTYNNQDYSGIEVSFSTLSEADTIPITN